MDNPQKYKQLVYDIIGAAYAVHKELHGGLLEQVYQEALAFELKEKGIDCLTEQEVNIYYKSHLLSKKYRMDILVGDIVVELKSVGEVTTDHRAQLCNYLRLSHKPIGLLINFGRSSLYGERWYFDQATNECHKLDKEMQILSRRDV